MLDQGALSGDHDQAGAKHHTPPRPPTAGTVRPSADLVFVRYKAPYGRTGRRAADLLDRGQGGANACSGSSSLRHKLQPKAKIERALLGDDSIERQTLSKTLRVEFGQTIARATIEWNERLRRHLYSTRLTNSVLKNFVGTPPRVNNIRGGDDGACALRFRDRQSIRFQTYSHPEFKFYYNLFYPAHDPEGGRSPNRKKRVPENIGNYLLQKPSPIASWTMALIRPTKIEPICFQRTHFTRTLFVFLLALILTVIKKDLYKL